jgi:tetraacyldisaccharide 4'-kinase
MGPLFRFIYPIVSRGPETGLEKLVFPLLLACSWIYGSIGLLRSFLYRFHILSSYQAEVPVISVGNLSSGGTGKTPIVDYLARHLLSIGKKTAVVSRGYGREDTGQSYLVSSGNGPLISPGLAGDEPFLLARRNPSLIVIVAANRKEGIASAVKDHGAEVVILDDGFQHLAARRDLNIVLLDSEFPLGSGRVLPAGTLREFPSALKRGDLFIMTRMEKGTSASIELPGEVLSCRHKISTTVISLDGESDAINALTSRRGGAFAGIAAPQKFFADLEEAGLNIEKTAIFQDHVNYGTMEKKQLVELGRDMDYLITTEKDAVKLCQEDLNKVCYAVPLSLEFFENNKLEAIISRLF